MGGSGRNQTSKPLCPTPPNLPSRDSCFRWGFQGSPAGLSVGLKSDHFSMWLGVEVTRSKCF